MKKMFIEVNQIHNFMSSSGSGTVINYGSGSNFLTSYGSGSGSTTLQATLVSVFSKAELSFFHRAGFKVTLPNYFF